MSRGGQGQSAITVDKERRIAAAMSVGMRIANSRFAGRGFKYWHFDANAGSGWNTEVNVPGSPLVFWAVARECLSGMEPYPFFCDFNQSYMKELQGRLATNPDSRVGSFLLPGDNEDAMRVFAQSIRNAENPKHAIGSVIVDPNGYFYRKAKNGEGVPANILPDFCREFPKIDLILNLNIRAYHLQKSQNHFVRPPVEVLYSLGKKQWLVSRTGGSGARFMLAIGRNITTGDHKNLGLHDLNSELGQYIISSFDGRRQNEIEYDLPDLSRIPLAPGIPRGKKSGDGSSGWSLQVRSLSDGSPPLQRVSAMGHVRRSVEPRTDLPQMSLFGARKE